MAQCALHANGDGASSCSFSHSLPVFSASKEAATECTGVVVDIRQDQSKLLLQPSRFSWLIRSCFQPSCRKPAQVDAATDGVKAATKLRTILLLGRAAELLASTKADEELRAWLDADPAALYALLAASSYAAAGKAFQLRLQIGAQHAGLSTLLPHRLLLADYGKQHGDLVAQSCLVQEDATGGCSDARPAVLICTAAGASRLSGSSRLDSPATACTRQSTAFPGQEPKAAATGASRAGGATASPTAAAAAVRAAAAAAVSASAYQRGASLRQAASSSLQPVTPTTPQASAPLVVTADQPAATAPLPPSAAAAIADVTPAAAAAAATAGGVISGAGEAVAPQLLALDEGPYLVTIAQYPGGVVLYQNKRSRELLGDLCRRPVGRLLLQELLGHQHHRDRDRDRGRASSWRRSPEAQALLEGLLEGAARGQSFCRVVSVPPYLPYRLAAVHSAAAGGGRSTSKTGAMQPATSGSEAFGAVGNARADADVGGGASGGGGGGGDDLEAGTSGASAACCATFITDDPLITISPQCHLEVVSGELKTSDSLEADRKLLDALVKPAATAAAKCARSQGKHACMVASDRCAHTGAGAAAVWDARMSVPLRMLGFDGGDGVIGSGGGGGRVSSYGNGSFCGIKTDSGPVQPVEEAAGLTASVSGAANIGIFVGGDVDGDDDGLVSDLALPLPPQRQPQPQPHDRPQTHPRPQYHATSRPATQSSLLLQGGPSEPVPSVRVPSAPSRAVLPRARPEASPEVSAPLPLLHALASFAPPQPSAASAAGVGADPPLPRAHTLQRLKDAATAIAASKKRQAPRRLASALTVVTSGTAHSSPLVKMAEGLVAAAAAPPLMAAAPRSSTETGVAAAPDSAMVREAAGHVDHRGWRPDTHMLAGASSGGRRGGGGSDIDGAGWGADRVARPFLSPKLRGGAGLPVAGSPPGVPHMDWPYGARGECALGRGGVGVGVIAGSSAGASALRRTAMIRPHLGTIEDVGVEGQGSSSQGSKGPLSALPADIDAAADAVPALAESGEAAASAGTGAGGGAGAGTGDRHEVKKRRTGGDGGDGDSNPDKDSSGVSAGGSVTAGDATIPIIPDAAAAAVAADAGPAAASFDTAPDPAAAAARAVDIPGAARRRSPSPDPLFVLDAASLPASLPSDHPRLRQALAHVRPPHIHIPVAPRPCFSLDLELPPAAACPQTMVGPASVGAPHPCGQCGMGGRWRTAPGSGLDQPQPQLQQQQQQRGDDSFCWCVGGGGDGQDRRSRRASVEVLHHPSVPERCWAVVASDVGTTSAAISYNYAAACGRCGGGGDCHAQPLPGPVQGGGTAASGSSVGGRRRRPPPHVDPENRVRQLLTNFSSLLCEQRRAQQQHNLLRHKEQEHHWKPQLHQHHSLPIPSPLPPQQLQPRQSLPPQPQTQTQTQQQYYHVFHAVGCGPASSGGSATASGFMNRASEQLGADVASFGVGDGDVVGISGGDAASNSRLPPGAGSGPNALPSRICTCGTHCRCSKGGGGGGSGGQDASGAAPPVEVSSTAERGRQGPGDAPEGPLHARYLPAAEPAGPQGAPTTTAAVAAAAVGLGERSSSLRTVSAWSRTAGADNQYCNALGGHEHAQITASPGPGKGGGGGTGGECVAPAPVPRAPMAASPQTVWHRVHVRALQGVCGPIAAAAGGATGAASNPKSVRTGAGDGGDVGGVRGCGSSAARQLSSVSIDGRPSLAAAAAAVAAQQQQPPQVLVITQVDVSAEVAAQRQTAGLLQEEHRLLESIFPRHCIEYLTLRGGAHGGGRYAAKNPSLIRGMAATASSVAAAGGGEGGGAEGDTAEEEATAAAAAAAAAALEAGPARLASLATWHPCVTILFCDIVGFTTACQATSPFAVMSFLNDLYSRFDGLVDIYKVYKVETIGDCYMVAGGLVAYDEDGYKSVISGTEDPLHAVRTLEFAKSMLRVSREVRMPHTGEPVQLRVGLHSGPVTSGVVGDTMPRFCLFGDTVNTASRMESTCRPGRIHVSAATRERLPSEPWRDLGMAAVKGKGDMRTYEWAGDVDGPLDGEQVTRVLGLYL